MQGRLRDASSEFMKVDAQLVLAIILGGAGAAYGEEPGIGDPADLYGDGSSFSREEDLEFGSQEERDLPLDSGSLAAREQEQRQFLEARRCRRLIAAGLPLTEASIKRCYALLGENYLTEDD